jgi:perosamine synthetase
MKTFIPVNKPRIPKNADKYIKDCLKSGWLSSEGPYVTKFENEFAKYLDCRYASTTNSGTTALHLALLALGLGKGDEVILPASTIGSCYFAIWYTGATAIPVDVDPITFSINPDLIRKFITPKSKAIMVVHLFGQPCRMDKITEIANEYNLAIIEDAAEAHGAEYFSKKVGTIGKVGIFSFYANKLVTTGEGGMVVTNDKKIYECVQKIKNLNHSKTRFIHDGIGYKYVMSNLQAAVGLASLEEIDKSIQYKREMADLYYKHLSKIKGLTLMEEQPGVKNTFWMYTILVDANKFGISSTELSKILSTEYYIQTRTFFYPPNIAFKSLDLYNNQIFPVAEKISRDGLYLPSGLGNTKSDFLRVCMAIRKIVKLKTKRSYE